MLRPNMEGWYRREGQAYIRINSDGLRDREHAKVKPADTVRIAILGDSYAEAFQVPMENTFWYLIEQRVRSCEVFGGKSVEVINFGVQGYSTAQELITLQNQVWNYSPDIVLLAVTTSNDIIDNSRTLKKDRHVPYFILGEGGLVLDDSFKNTRVFRLRNSALARLGNWFLARSRVMQLVDDSFLRLKYYRTSRKLPATPSLVMTFAGPNGRAEFQVTAEFVIDQMLYREPRDQAWIDAWSVTEALITQINLEVKAHGAKLLVVTLSNVAQLNPDPAERRAYFDKVGAKDIFYPDNRIKALGDHVGFAVLNLAPPLQAYAESHQAHLHGFGESLTGLHWNLEGHRVVGEIVSQRICEGIAR